MQVRYSKTSVTSGASFICLYVQVTLLTKSCKQFKAAGLRGLYKTLEYLYSKNVDYLSSMSIKMKCLVSTLYYLLE